MKYKTLEEEAKDFVKKKEKKMTARVFIEVDRALKISKEEMTKQINHQFESCKKNTLEFIEEVRKLREG